MSFLNKRNVFEFLVENTFYITSELFLTKELLANIPPTQLECESGKYIRGYGMKNNKG
jgi:hypothetical protein